MESYKVLSFTAAHKVTLHIIKIMFIGKVFTIFIFIPQVFAVVGKTFIYGKIAPAFSRYQVAKPLVKQFMRNGFFPAIAISQLAVVLVSAILVQGSSSI